MICICDVLFFLQMSQKDSSIGSTKNSKFMMKNGESVLKELIPASNGIYFPYRIFSAKEFKVATNNYDKQNIRNRAFCSNLCKGIWQDRLISVMKFDKSCKQLSYGWSSNNIVYASQMSHKHILKLIGCCLETNLHSSF